LRWVVLLLLSCTYWDRVQNDDLEEAGRVYGDLAAELMLLPETASEDAIKEHVRPASEALAQLALEHVAYRGLPVPSAAAGAIVQSQLFQWDGTLMNVEWGDSETFTPIFTDVKLRIRDYYLLPDSVDDDVVDQWYRVYFALADGEIEWDFKVDASFDHVAVDYNGCPASGDIIVEYEVTRGEELYLVAEFKIVFGGCYKTAIYLNSAKDFP